MVIKRSSAREVSALIEELETAPGDAREAAVARLAVIGTRAVEALHARLAAGPPPARAGAMSALEAIADPRSADVALSCLDDDQDEVRTGAAALLRRLLDSPKGAEVLDRVTAIAVDPARADRVRLAALEALRGVSVPALELLSQRLHDDPSLAVRATVTGGGPQRVVLPPLEALEQAADGALPEDADAMRQWLAVAGSQAPLPTLHRLVQRIRERERATADPTGRAAWTTARGLAHQVLAERGSTVALYDLRETFESGEPAAVEMLAALRAIGDRSCLDAIAAAYGRLTGDGADTDGAAWWRQHLAEVFRTIATREKLTDRHADAKRIRARWPEAADVLLGPRR